MRYHRPLSTFLVSFAGSMAAIAVTAIIEGVTAKMIYEYLINFNLLYVPVVFFVAFTIYSGYRLVRQRWKISIEEKEEELSDLKSKFKEEKEHLKARYEEKTKQYNELCEKTKLPKALDRALTVEIDPKWYRSNRVIVKDTSEKFPHLYFFMRVVNRTYHSFDEPEVVSIRCFNGWGDMKKKVCTDRIDKEQRESAMIETASEVWKFDDGTFVVHCPIEKLYDDLEKWTLTGTVKYRSKEPLIEDSTQYANPELKDIDLRYALSEKQISELKEKIEEALGDDSE